MKVLVIPDVHLKPEMFRNACRLMKQGIAERAVCLMDLPDDWDKQYDVALYEETYDEAIRFAKEFPKTLWCYGNHDLSYPWYRLESGYSSMASYAVQKKLFELKTVVSEECPISYVQKIDQVLFSHGGVSDQFVKMYISGEQNYDTETVVEKINQLGSKEMWTDESPIWLRPQNRNVKLYRSNELLQVVGHTPMKEITKKGNLISCDVFSTYNDGTLIGTGEFLLLDTKSWDYMGIKL